jgi:biopolymer transport protein ExbD
VRSRCSPKRVKSVPKRHTKEVEEEVFAEVNIIPLADVCLTLVISPMIMQSMLQVQPSQAVEAPSSVSPGEKPIFIDITQEGFRVNGNLMPTEYDLYRTLQKNLSRMKERTVLITSAENVVYQNVIKVLDIAKQSGAKSLSLVPRKRE